MQSITIYKLIAALALYLSDLFSFSWFKMETYLESEAGLRIEALTLQWRSCAEKGEVTAMTAFHCHSVQQPFAWDPNLSNNSRQQRNDEG